MTDSITVCSIIPTYNRSQFIGECIRSLLDQTYPVSQIIVVDDGSTDDTYEVVNAFGDKVTYLLKENGGKSSALNFAMKYCTSDFVWICDDDDDAAKDGLSHLIDAMKKYPEAGYAYGTFQCFEDLNGKRKFSDYKFGKRHNEPNDKINFLEGMFTIQFSFIVKKSVYDEIGLFSENLLRSQDYDMMLRISRKFVGAFTPHNIFFYRLHLGQRGNSKKIFKPEDNQKKWLMYDRIIFSEVKSSYSLDEFIPTFALDHVNSLKNRAAHIQRAVIFAKRGMWEQTSRDIKDAIHCSNLPLSTEEKLLCLSVVHGKLAWFYILETPQVLIELSSILKDVIGKEIICNLTRPLFWILRDQLKNKKYQEAFFSFRILYQILGFKGMSEVLLKKEV